MEDVAKLRELADEVEKPDGDKKKAADEMRGLADKVEGRLEEQRLREAGEDPRDLVE